MYYIINKSTMEYDVEHDKCFITLEDAVREFNDFNNDNSVERPNLVGKFCVVDDNNKVVIN